MEYLSLIQRTQLDDAGAFGEIYDLYAQKIFRYVKIKIKNQQQAEDILQEVFVKAWNGLPSFKTHNGNFSAWLYRIACNQINDYFRKIYNTPQITDLNDQVYIQDTLSVAEEFVQKNDIQVVKKAFNLLHPKFRQVLQLRFIQDLTYKETADALKKSNIATRMIQHRALKKLREILKEKSENN